MFHVAQDIANDTEEVLSSTECVLKNKKVGLGGRQDHSLKHIYHADCIHNRFILQNVIPINSIPFSSVSKISSSHPKYPSHRLFLFIPTRPIWLLGKQNGAHLRYVGGILTTKIPAFEKKNLIIL